ncbi:hypothetical protein shim_25340 [Shimia sp. SK013]|uniref:hypothetical protein n=1 Tax=Shimia sp. SK013 TaxID=1389006 RepID=UPI0006B466A8|nr:hypothetical protein [Shimia sp. SK013]KPA21069.1 hypothetical protein shim_25340 [Shimia sp. SK013]
MITEIVSFDLPADMPRDTVLALFEQTVARWQGHPDLIRKQYLYDAGANRGGGVYLWATRAAAESAHDSAWCDTAETLYGSRPTFAYFETPFVVDNRAGEILR